MKGVAVMIDYHTLQAMHPHLALKYNEPLAFYSYTQTGGKADAIVFPASREEVLQVLAWVQANRVPLTVLGNLSNLIVRDGGIEGLVMILTRMNSVRSWEQGLYAESGAAIIQVSRDALAHSLTGLEFACGIPGSVGGAVFMNAGAYDGEVKDCIAYVDVLTAAGHLERIPNEACHFAYRNSIFQNNGQVIIGAAFTLPSGDASKIKAEMDRITFLRESKQPLEYPSCGSVFKRPVGYYTGKLIQDAGLQGFRIGGAEVSRKHAGFIVNVDHATATDYTRVIAHIQAQIMEKYQVHLETEVRIIGRDTDDQAEGG